MRERKKEEKKNEVRNKWWDILVETEKEKKERREERKKKRKERKKEEEIATLKAFRVYRTTLGLTPGILDKEEQRSKQDRKKRVFRAFDQQRRGDNIVTRGIVTGPTIPLTQTKREKS